MSRRKRKKLRRREAEREAPAFPIREWAEKNGLYILACDGKWVWYCRRSGADLLTWNPETGWWNSGSERGVERHWKDAGARAVFMRDRVEASKRRAEVGV
jgi:hypothetical protein